MLKKPYRMHEPPKLIKPKDIENILAASPLPLTSTQITKEITGRKLVWEAEDKKVRRHLSRMIDYNVLVVVGFDDDKEPYYQYRHKTTQAFNNSSAAAYEVLRRATHPLTAEEVCLRMFPNPLTAEFMLSRVRLWLDLGTRNHMVLRENPTKTVIYSAGKALRK